MKEGPIRGPDPVRARCGERCRAETYVDVAGAFMVALDRDGIITLINRKGCKVLGYSAEELVGQDWFGACVPAKVRHEVRGSFARIVAGEVEPMEYDENPVVAKDGQEYLIAWHNAILRDEDERISGTLSSGEVITDRHRIEETLRASEARCRSLLDHIGEGLVQVDTEDRILFINDRLCHMLKRSREELLGAIGHEVFSVDERGRELIREKNRLRGDGISDAYETTMLRSDGTVISVSISGAPLFGPDGQVSGSVGLIADITERTRAEEELRRSEAFNHAVIQNSPIGISVRNRTGQLLSANDAWKEIWAIPEPVLTDDATRERQALAFNHRDGYLLPYQDEVRRVYEQGGHLRIPELRIGHFRPGAAEWVSQHFYAIQDAHGTVDRVVILTEDITDRKKAEEERDRLQAQLLHAQKMEAVGRLAGGVAHDFNNMMQVVLGRVEIVLAKMEKKDPFRPNLEEIREAARRSTDLTRQLLAFARKQIVQPRVIDLSDLIDGMLKMLRRLIGEDVRLSWKPKAGLWSVRMDPSQVDQILANLCVNARDAIGGVGEVIIATENVLLDAEYCASHAGREPGPYVMLAVSDDGCGIRKEMMEHLFEPFFTTKGVGEGTGLGLSTVHGIVTQNNGFIEVYSEVGSGTTFRIYLPRHRSENEEAWEVADAALPQRGGETVLLVEDDPAILPMGAEMLQGLGYQVVCAGTPGEALHKAEEHGGEIDLLITDVVMPEMNGRELAGRIAAMNPGLRCLYMSGYTADAIAHHGVLDEGVHFVQKPFTLTQLSEKVREAIEG